MKWETDIYPFLNKEDLEHWATSDTCETALINWVDAWQPATLALMYYRSVGDRRECVWYLGRKDFNGPAQGYWFAWSGEVQDMKASNSFLCSVLRDVQQFPALTDITFDSMTEDSKMALADFKRRWPLIYGMEYNPQWLVSFCKSIDMLEISHREPKGHETHFGADVEAAREWAAAMMNDADVLEAAAKYVEPLTDMHSGVQAVMVL